MGDRFKPGDDLFIPAVQVLGAAPQAIIGVGGAVAFRGGQQAIVVQNRSGADIEISTVAGAASGLLLTDGESLSVNVGEAWTGTIWGVVGAAITVAVGQLGSQ